MDLFGMLFLRGQVKETLIQRDVWWEGRMYEKKEVTVYDRVVGERVVVLTVKARYGRDFAAG